MATFRFTSSSSSICAELAMVRQFPDPSTPASPIASDGGSPILIDNVDAVPSINEPSTLGSTSAFNRIGTSDDDGPLFAISAATSSASSALTEALSAPFLLYRPTSNRPAVLPDPFRLIVRAATVELIAGTSALTAALEALLVLAATWPSATISALIFGAGRVSRSVTSLAPSASARSPSLICVPASVWYVRRFRFSADLLPSKPVSKPLSSVELPDCTVARPVPSVNAPTLMTRDVAWTATVALLAFGALTVGMNQ
jgi:hypothetical protein